MSAWRRLLAGTLLAGMVGFGSTVAVAGPASAYGSFTLRYAVVDTGNCNRLSGNIQVIAEAGGCRLNDSADGTFFRTDSGGRAVKIEIHVDGSMVAKQEFHPYGEYLWVYDTRNDGDAVYTWLGIEGVGQQGPYAPNGTSNVVDYEVINFSIDEGAGVTVIVHDTSSILDRDFFTSQSGRA